MLDINQQFVQASRLKYRVRRPSSQPAPQCPRALCSMTSLPRLLATSVVFHANQGEMNQSHYPPIKINFTSVQKLVPELTKNTVKLAIESLFSQVQEVTH